MKLEKLDKPILEDIEEYNEMMGKLDNWQHSTCPVFNTEKEEDKTQKLKNLAVPLMIDHTSHIEKMLINFIENWCEVEMKDYTDKQYGKGDFKKLLNKAKDMLTERDKHWDNDVVTYPNTDHIIPLIPCPKCNGDAQFVNIIIDQTWAAECTKCGLWLGEYSSRLDLCNDWNKRENCDNGN